MQYKFSAHQRLKNKPQFQLVFKNGTKLSLNGLAVYYQNNSLQYPRLGISLTKRNVSSAADRNRIKRIIRESFRLQQHDLPNNDLVVVAYGNTVGFDNNKIFNNLAKLWQQLNSGRKS